MMSIQRIVTRSGAGPARVRSAPGLVGPTRLLGLALWLVGHSLATATPASTTEPDLAIRQYHLSLRLDLRQSGWSIHQNQLEGSARITLRNEGSPLDRIPVMLHRLMTLDAARTADGRPLSVSQRIKSLPDWPTYQANVAMVTLDTTLPHGGEMTLSLDYHGHLQGYTESGMLYVKEQLDPEFTIIRSETAAYPLPTVASRKGLSRFYARNTAFEQRLDVTVPDGSVVASGHELLARDSVEGWVTWRYRSRKPAPVIMLPVAPYEIIDLEGVRIYHFAEDRIGAQRVADGIARAMALFTDWFGPLHDPSSFAVAEIPERYGSQALRPTVLQTADAFRDAAGMPQLYHEISHFWNVEDPDPESSRWNEGWATYLQAVVSEVLDGETGRVAEQMNRLMSRLRIELVERPEYRGVPLIEAGERGMTSLLAYAGGGLFFGLMEDRLGRERLLTLMGAFYQQYRVSGARSHQLVDFLLGQAPETEPIVRDWLLTGAWSERLLESDTLQVLGSGYAAP